MEAQIYTKICLHCVYGEMFNKTMTLMNKQGIVAETVRTQYLPKAHAEATKLYGNENYVAFIYFPTTKKVIDFTEFMKQIDNGINIKDEEEMPKTKVNIRKTKPAKGGKKK